MNMTPEAREKLLINFATIITALFTVLAVVLVFAQAYIRWAVNQNFTFLGGYELEVLTVSVVLLTLGLLRHIRRTKALS